tara:strand:- start:1173 stop:1730 length:558 start_codon:yes stop_codon:yes gene_type:complete
MANTTFNGPVRSEKGFKVITKNADTGAITQSRMSSGMPDLTGLALNDLATGSSIELDDNSLNVVNYTGAAACAATLPAAEAGSVCVYVQALDTAGGTNTLTFDAAGSDVWATGSVIESRGSDEVTFDISTAGETQLVFTPVDAATNLFTTGSMIAFICYEKGTWHIASKMTGSDDAVKGAFAFAA